MTRLPPCRAAPGRPGPERKPRTSFRPAALPVSYAGTERVRREEDVRPSSRRSPHSPSHHGAPYLHDPTRRLEDLAARQRIPARRDRRPRTRNDATLRQVPVAATGKRVLPQLPDLSRRPAPGRSRRLRRPPVTHPNRTVVQTLHSVFLKKINALQPLATGATPPSPIQRQAVP